MKGLRIIEEDVIMDAANDNKVQRCTCKSCTAPASHFMELLIRTHTMNLDHPPLISVVHGNICAEHAETNFPPNEIYDMAVTVVERLNIPRENLAAAQLVARCGDYRARLHELGQMMPEPTSQTRH